MLSLAVIGLLIDLVGFLVISFGAAYPLWREPAAENKDQRVLEWEESISKLERSHQDDLDRMRRTGQEHDMRGAKQGHRGSIEYQRNLQSRFAKEASAIRAQARKWQSISILAGSLIVVVGLGFQIAGSQVLPVAIEYRWIGYSG